LEGWIVMPVFGIGRSSTPSLAQQVAVLALPPLLLAACASPPMPVASVTPAPAVVASVPPPAEAPRPEPPGQRGKASYYADTFEGRTTASGEIFTHEKLTAASRTLPLGTRVRVTNEENDKSVVVRINDRGPYVRGRIIDLSKAAAHRLGIVEDGVADVRIEPLDGANQPVQQASD